MSHSSLTRREFVRLATKKVVATSAAMKFTVLESNLLSAHSHAVPPSDKVRFASIGTGVRGCELLQASLRVPVVPENVIAVEEPKNQQTSELLCGAGTHGTDLGVPTPVKSRIRLRTPLITFSLSLTMGDRCNIKRPILRVFPVGPSLAQDILTEYCQTHIGWHAGARREKSRFDFRANAVDVGRFGPNRDHHVP